jgi:hypothetical protein
MAFGYQIGDKSLAAEPVPHPVNVFRSSVGHLVAKIQALYDQRGAGLLGPEGHEYTQSPLGMVPLGGDVEGGCFHELLLPCPHLAFTIWQPPLSHTFQGAY